ncbi:two-component sensor histidine kinase [Salipiger sp. IMCC34102]|uniref:ATP-binding protein n=1 Tax=Salipiger sp. IMCC34102 TaxID=2510647 RepID=UPI00101DB568|nr:ATP-binding protein [Salipiger sp. IMCC34102]RYH03150.1 two-component sensor histidine kinase [Salipiger sp. IMCC34102]
MTQEVPIDALPVPVAVIGPDQTVTAMSPAMQAILSPKLVGRHYITVLRQPVLLDAIEATRADRQPRNATYLGRDGGRDVTWEVAIRASDRRLLLVFEDQTAAQAVGQLRRDFVANVSHELRTPLTALQGFIETLGGAARDDAAARDRFLGIMARETTRMTQLVDDLLSLSRVEDSERQRPRDPVALGALVAGTLEDLGPVIADTGLGVTFADDSGGAQVPGDANQLRQVVVNLVQNALKYGAGGGSVDLVLEAPAPIRKLRGQGLALQVRDHGQGIAAHHLPRLTERFYRIDTHRDRSLGGTGLGLAIVKHILNRHRGRLLIESTLGEGTVFTVLLPLET